MTMIMINLTMASTEISSDDIGSKILLLHWPWIRV